jgi:DNA-binding NarL/FixJ family response regulator
MRLLIVEDQTLMAEALRKLLESEFESIVIVETGHELLDAVASSKPDVVLLDIDMPLLNGIEATRSLGEISSAMKVIVLTGHDNPQYVVEAFGAGAMGFARKRCTVSELVTAIHCVLDGKPYVTPLMAPYSAPSAKESGRQQMVELTARQREVLQLVAEGCTAKEIAYALNLSVKTAVYHRMAIKEKLGLHTTAELTRYALEHGIGTRTYNRLAKVAYQRPKLVRI